MNLDQFIAAPDRNLHVREPGLEYYVRKSLLFPGMIELASCVAKGREKFGYWRFLKKYEARVPFMAEQVFNPALAALYRRRGWLEWVRDEIPQFASPLAVATYGQHPHWEAYTRSWSPACFTF